MVLIALLALLGAVLASFAVGPLRLPPLEVMQALAVKLGLLDPQSVSSRDLAVVWQLRIPRALLGAMVGAALAMAGASLQGLFGNPLADPGIVGVTQGAALGAVAGINYRETPEWAEDVRKLTGGAGVQHVIWSTLEDTRTIFAADGNTPFIVDLDRSPPSLVLDPRSELAYRGIRRP